MSDIEYLNFDQVDLHELMNVVNQDSLRAHLVSHPYFDLPALQTWINEKLEIDGMAGCQVRVVYIDGILAGWCGIQPDDKGVEVAIVISQKFWGAGIPIFNTLMYWARELGHNEVRFHLLDTRRQYKALAKKASKVISTQLLGRRFYTYYFPVF